MHPATRHALRLSGGTELSFLSAGNPSHPALLLLHGFPSSARAFRAVIPVLAQVAHVIAPDLPGFGRSEPLAAPAFAALGAAVEELLERLAIGRRYVYLHDYGAPVGLHVAMRAPDLVAGLIVQNANAHATGLGPQWDATRAFWARPTPENRAAATAHLSREGIRDQYVAGVPPEIAERIGPEVWEEDWRVMRLPGRLETQRALVADYASHVARFDAIARYLAEHEPPALLVWGRHDAFFDVAEVLSWMQALPRMEAHVFDAGHMLLETHAAPAAERMVEFLRQTEARRAAGE